MSARGSYALIAAMISGCGGGVPTLPVIDVTPDAGFAYGACDPFTQMYCPVGAKCTWIIDQLGTGSAANLGHIGCAPDGSNALGAACMYASYDDCAGGLACVDATCEALCDPSISSGCAPGTACTVHADFYDEGPTAVAGVCDPS